jgi:hypothetical protein
VLRLRPPLPTGAAACAGEEALRAHPSYTIVRPGGLKNAPGGQHLIGSTVNNTKESGSGSIPRADVAAVCVDALSRPAARNVTVSVFGGGPLPEGRSVGEVLASVWAGSSGKQ